MPSLAGLGTFLGGAASLGGALFGGGDEGTGSVNYNRDMHQKDWRNFGEAVRQYEEQKDFARDVWKKSVQTRVADAKAAGIHPLFALGASLPGGSFGSTVSPSSFSGGAGSSGRDPFAAAAYGLEAMGRGAQSMRKTPVDPKQKEIEALQLRRLHAQVQQDEALAAKMLSDAAVVATRAASNRDAGQVVPGKPEIDQMVQEGQFNWPDSYTYVSQNKDIGEYLLDVLFTAVNAGRVTYNKGKAALKGAKTRPLAPYQKNQMRKLAPKYRKAIRSLPPLGY